MLLSGRKNYRSPPPPPPHIISILMCPTVEGAISLLTLSNCLTAGWLSITPQWKHQISIITVHVASYDIFTMRGERRSVTQRRGPEWWAWGRLKRRRRRRRTEDAGKGRMWSQSREVCRSEKAKKEDKNIPKKSGEERSRGEDRVANQWVVSERKKTAICSHSGSSQFISASFLPSSGFSPSPHLDFFLFLSLSHTHTHTHTHLHIHSSAKPTNLTGNNLFCVSITEVRPASS